MPLTLVAQALDTGEAEFAFRPDGKLADGYISFTWVATDLPSGDAGSVRTGACRRHRGTAAAGLFHRLSRPVRVAAR